MFFRVFGSIIASTFMFLLGSSRFEKSPNTEATSVAASASLPAEIPLVISSEKITASGIISSAKVLPKSEVSSGKILPAAKIIAYEKILPATETASPKILPENGLSSGRFPVKFDAPDTFDGALDFTPTFVDSAVESATSVPVCAALPVEDLTASSLLSDAAGSAISTENLAISTENLAISMDNTPLGMDNTPLGMDNAPLGMENAPLGMDNTPLGMDNALLIQDSALLMADGTVQQACALGPALKVNSESAKLTSNISSSISQKIKNLADYFARSGDSMLRFIANPIAKNRKIAIENLMPVLKITGLLLCLVGLLYLLYLLNKKFKLVQNFRICISDFKVYEYAEAYGLMGLFLACNAFTAGFSRIFAFLGKKGMLSWIVCFTSLAFTLMIFIDFLFSLTFLNPAIENGFTVLGVYRAFSLAIEHVMGSAFFALLTLYTAVYGFIYFFYALFKVLGGLLVSEASALLKNIKIEQIPHQIYQWVSGQAISWYLVVRKVFTK